jgi:hypothetical protein
MWQNSPRNFDELAVERACPAVFEGG